MARPAIQLITLHATECVIVVVMLVSTGDGGDATANGSRWNSIGVHQDAAHHSLLPWWRLRCSVPQPEPVRQILPPIGPNL